MVATTPPTLFDNNPLLTTIDVSDNRIGSVSPDLFKATGNLQSLFGQCWLNFIRPTHCLQGPCEQPDNRARKQHLHNDASVGTAVG